MDPNDTIAIKSSSGSYEVRFRDTVERAAADLARDRPIHVIIDSRVAALHKRGLAALLDIARHVYEVEALEDNKSLEQAPALVRRLAAGGIRRDHVLVAVGGGIVQDMTCFVASILFGESTGRSCRRHCWPRRLLIGSKSSINAAGIKNLVGNFYPPMLISIATEFLGSLDERDVRSGVGEMLKVHIIDGPESFDRISAAYEALFDEAAVMRAFIRDSLLIKRRLIEIDEFDRGPRNVMNYGHSFGHAIEAATDFAVPHGIAVTMGMDMANFVAVRMERLPPVQFERMHGKLKKNYSEFERIPVPMAKLLDALSRDKKNIGADLTLILPNANARIEKVRVTADQKFEASCREFLEAVRVDA